MTDLVVCLSTGKGTWKEVLRLIESENWENVFLITNEFGKEKFAHKKAQHIIINRDASLKALSEEILHKLKSKLGFGDVAVNIVSGSGKEHMALLSALLKLGVGIRLVAEEDEKMIAL